MCGDIKAIKQADPRQTINLCAPCHRLWLKADGHKTVKYRDAYRGNLYWLLITLSENPALKPDLLSVLETIPWSVRFCWYHMQSGFNTSLWELLFDEILHVKPLFVDITCFRRKWTRLLEKSSLLGGNMTKYLNLHCVPTVMCPMGCTHFAVDEGELIQLNDYFAWKLSKYAYLDSDPENFNGARGGFPSQDKLLDYKIRPALVFDDKHGVAILTCPKSQQPGGGLSHPIKGKTFFHVGSPGVCDVVANDRRLFAPATFSVNKLREQKTGRKYTSTGRTLKLNANAAGASVFSVCVDPKNGPLKNSMDPDYYIPPAVAIHNSKHIRDFVRAAYKEAAEEGMKDYIDCASETLKEISRKSGIPVSLDSIAETIKRQATMVAADLSFDLLDAWTAWPEDDQDCNRGLRSNRGSNRDQTSERIQLGSTVASLATNSG